MSKTWELLPKFSQNLSKTFPDLHPVILQLLFNRQLAEKSEIESFLNPDFEKEIKDPFIFRDMEAATELVIKHIKEQSKITIYADYDADGVTSASVLFDALSMLKAKVEVYIPDRVSEGYSLNTKAIDEIAESGSKLIITVDCGIRNKREVEYAKEKLDVIITDHHLPPEEEGGLPDCLIINPVVQNEPYPFKKLAGVGVAFKFAQAIISKAKISEETKNKISEQLLDLVAIGTVADCVSLLGENRALVKRGLEVLNKSKRLGLKELFKAAQLNEERKLDAWNISFQIAPRLNSAGRMDHANTAFELLVTKDKEEAAALARDLNEKNLDRQRTIEDIVDQISSSLMIDKNPGNIITVISPEDNPWNEGVIGLVASKICDRFYRPALVITQAEEGLKGSGRSIKEFNIVKALEKCSLYLAKYGGHPAACGFSLNKENMAGFLEKITALANNELKAENLQPRIIIEAETDLEAVSLSLAEDLEGFSPFGQNNEKPKFLSKELTVVDILTMGLTGQHLKLKLKSANSGILTAIGFGQAEQWSGLRIGDKIDLVYNLEINEFNGRREAQLKIIDIKANE